MARFISVPLGVQRVIMGRNRRIVLAVRQIARVTRCSIAYTKKTWKPERIFLMNGLPLIWFAHPPALLASPHCVLKPVKWFSSRRGQPCWRQAGQDASLNQPPTLTLIQAMVLAWRFAPVSPYKTWSSGNFIRQVFMAQA